MAEVISFPACRVCNTGQLVPLSDHSGDGDAVLFKSWTCINPACLLAIRLHKGDLFRTIATVVASEPPQDTPPVEPPTSGGTWQTFGPKPKR